VSEYLVNEYSGFPRFSIQPRVNKGFLMSKDLDTDGKPLRKSRSCLESFSLDPFWPILFLLYSCSFSLQTIPWVSLISNLTARIGFKFLIWPRGAPHTLATTYHLTVPKMSHIYSLQCASLNKKERVSRPFFTF
jgi:hypothetical protein